MTGAAGLGIREFVQNIMGRRLPQTLPDRLELLGIKRKRRCSSPVVLTRAWSGFAL